MMSARESMAPCDYAQSSRKKDFPIGMRVLVFVDEDRESLGVLGALLMECGYQVTTAEHGNAVLELLRKNKGNYDLVISDFQMHEMDGFKLLEIIDVELDLPVILLSTNDETSHVRKGLLHGAADVLLKPVKIEEMKLIWKNVIRNDRNSLRNKKGSNNAKENEELPNEERKTLWSDSNGEQQHKKRRVSWSIDLHTRFVDAVNQLGIDKATPTRILKIMNIEGLTQFNIASHLQKYRRSLTNNCIGLDQQAYGTRLMDKDSGFNDSAHSILPCSSMEGGTSGDTFNDTGHSEFRSIQPMDSPIESALPDFTGSDPDAILIQSQVNKFFNQDSWQDGGVLYELWINSCRSCDAVPVEQWKDACQGSEITFEQPIDACRGGNAVTAEQWTNVCPGGGVPVGQWTNGCQSNDWQTVEQWTDACHGYGIPAGQWTDGCFGGSGVPMGDRDSDGALGGQQTDGSLGG